MSERFNASEQGTFVFSGDIDTIQEVFKSLKAKVLTYEYKANGKSARVFPEMASQTARS